MKSGQINRSATSGSNFSKRVYIMVLFCLLPCLAVQANDPDVADAPVVTRQYGPDNLVDRFIKYDDVDQGAPWSPQEITRTPQGEYITLQVDDAGVNFEIVLSDKYGSELARITQPTITPPASAAIPWGATFAIDNVTWTGGHEDNQFKIQVNQKGEIGVLVSYQNMDDENYKGNFFVFSRAGTLLQPRLDLDLGDSNTPLVISNLVCTVDDSFVFVVKDGKPADETPVIPSTVVEIKESSGQYVVSKSSPILIGGAGGNDINDYHFVNPVDPGPSRWHVVLKPSKVSGKVLMQFDNLFHPTYPDTSHSLPALRKGAIYVLDVDGSISATVKDNLADDSNIYFADNFVSNENYIFVAPGDDAGSNLNAHYLHVFSISDGSFVDSITPPDGNYQASDNVLDFGAQLDSSLELTPDNRLKVRYNNTTTGVSETLFFDTSGGADNETFSFLSKLDTSTSPYVSPSGNKEVYKVNKQPDITGSSVQGGMGVDLQSGAFTSSSVDLTIPGRGIDWAFSRSYNSNIYYAYGSPLGRAWNSPYFQRIAVTDLRSNGFGVRYQEDPSTSDLTFIDYDYSKVHITLFDDGGEELLFQSKNNGSAEWNSPSDVYAEMEHVSADKEIHITTVGGDKIIFYDFSEFAEGQDDATTDGHYPGRLKSIKNSQGDTITFRYLGTGPSARLGFTKDTLDKRVNFIYYPTDSSDLAYDRARHGLLKEIEEVGGAARKITFTYDGENRQLTKVEYPEESNGIVQSGSNSRVSVSYEYTGTTVAADFQQDIYVKNQLTSIIDALDQKFLEIEYSAVSGDDVNHFHHHHRVVSQTYGTEANYTDKYNFSYTHYSANDQTQNPADLILGPNEEDKVKTDCVVNDPLGAISIYRLNHYGNPIVTKILKDPWNDKSAAVAYDAVDQLSAYSSTASYDTEGRQTSTKSQLGVETVITYDTGAANRWGQANVLTSTQKHDSTVTQDLVTTMTYEANFGLLKTLINPLGRTTTYHYTANGQLEKVDYHQVTTGLDVTPHQIEESYVYNAHGQLKQSTDGEGYVTHYHYYTQASPGSGSSSQEGEGYLAKTIIDPGTGSGDLNITMQYEYDNMGNVSKVIDPKGYETTYTTNKLGMLLTTTRPDMNVTTLNYDANGQVVESIKQITDTFDDGIWGGTRKFTYSYDSIGNMLSQGSTELKTKKVDETVHTTPIETTYSYNAVGAVLEMEFPNDSTLTHEYDDATGLVSNSVVKSVEQSGTIENKTSFQYDDDLRQIRQVFPGGNHTTPTTPNLASFTVYDIFGRVTSQENEGNGTKTELIYDKNSNVVETKIFGSDNGTLTGNIVLHGHTLTEYDEIDRPWRSTVKRFAIGDEANATDSITETGYNKNSLVEKIKNYHGGVGEVSTVVYDKANRVVRTNDPKDNELSNTYDLNSNVVETVSYEVEESGEETDIFTTVYTVDNLNRVTAVTSVMEQDNFTTSYKLDSEGRSVEVTDANGVTIKKEFDDFGRLVSEHRPAWEGSMIVLRYEYDISSNRIKAKDGRGHITTYEYDGFNRLAKRINADAKERGYMYETDSSRLKTVTRENGDTITYNYDDAGRVDEQIHSDGTTSITKTFVYNGTSHLLKVTETGVDSSEIVYTRDSQGRMLTCTQTITEGSTTFPSKTFTITYDDFGNPTSMLYPGSRLVNFNYDYANNTLSNVKTVGFDGTSFLSDYGYDGLRMARRRYGNQLELRVGYDQLLRTSAYQHFRLPGTLELGFFETKDKVGNRVSETFMSDTLPQ